MEFEQLYDCLNETEVLEENTVCSALYEWAYRVREQLGTRLGTDADDPDLVQLVELHEAIQKELCRLTASRMGDK